MLRSFPFSFRSTASTFSSGLLGSAVLAASLGIISAGPVSAQELTGGTAPVKRTGPSARRDAGVAPSKGQAPAPAKPAVTLAEARELFARVDQDKNGELSIREADYAGLPANRTSPFDADGNGSLSPEEFLVAFHQSLSSGDRRAGSDLEAESARIQALRRAKDADRERAGGPSELRTKAGEAKDALQQRLRQAEVDQRLKEKAKSDLDTRINNAQNPGQGGGPSEGRGRAGEARPTMTRQPTPEETRAARETAEQRLREAEAAARRNQEPRRIAPPETARPSPTPPVERPAPEGETKDPGVRPPR